MPWLAILPGEAFQTSNRKTVEEVLLRYLAPDLCVARRGRLGSSGFHSVRHVAVAQSLGASAIPGDEETLRNTDRGIDVLYDNSNRCTMSVRPCVKPPSGAFSQCYCTLRF